MSTNTPAADTTTNTGTNTGTGTGTGTGSSSTEAKWPPEHTCACERCCCHVRVSKSGVFCWNCVKKCLKVPLMMGHLKLLDGEGKGKEGEKEKEGGKEKGLH